MPKTSSFAGLKKISWTYQKTSRIPLLIGIDQEGGKVNRLKEKYGFPRSISAAAMGKSGTLDSVHFYGESTAATLAGLGINVNFAPVVDLALNPENTVIVKVERAFSSREDSVVIMAREFIREHRKYGVITVLKHFPGHGSSRDDTHLGVADVTNTWSEKELIPYKQLIDSGYVDAIMTAHIVNKNLDPDGNPGTLSKAILDGILRKRLGYQGVVISDDMQMYAIAKNYGLEEAIRLAVNAGVDIMCFSNNIQGTEERTVDRVHAIIKGFVASGEIPLARIDESFHRVMRLKAGLSRDYRTEALKLEVENDQIRKENAQLRQQMTPKNEETDKKSRKNRKKKTKANN